MSNCTSQDKSSPGLGPAEVERVLADPKVQAKLAIRPRIDRNYDMPWLAGYSRDGRTIYMDRHLPNQLQIGKGVYLNVIPYLTLHEHVEKSIIDALGWKYSAAHTIAEQEEHRAVRAAGFLPKAYEAAIRPFLKADETEKIKRVPRDFDLTPFIDSNDHAMIAHLRSVMAR